MSTCTKREMMSMMVLEWHEIWKYFSYCFFFFFIKKEGRLEYLTENWKPELFA